MSNKYNWKTYDVPHRWVEIEGEEDGDNELRRLRLPPPSESFTIRHLKQGATGAVKTWPAAEVLLEYLVQRGGLRDIGDKIVTGGTGASAGTGDGERDVLNLTSPPSRPSFDKLKYSTITTDDPTQLQSEEQEELDPYHIVELGGGTGFLSVGLSLALNDTDYDDDDHTNDTDAGVAASASSAQRRRQTRKARLICTDNDRATIKNMRHNITCQPRHMNMNKMVRIEPLDWGCDVGGEKFSSAIRSQFRKQKITTTTRSSSSNNSIEEGGGEQGNNNDDDEDPITRLSHLIASDVHYGKTTLDPLSSVISAIKLRNPSVIVVLLLKERSPNAVTELKEEIESKVERGLQEQAYECDSSVGQCHYNTFSCHAKLRDFEVTVRDVIHNDLDNMKMVEC